ncbi:type II CAAX endopeptidase family protein [Cryptosporangium arvum]|uniref:type II CAAX endopeptidase family protein n=1 Tax=Cryptosporangium arvum TaxID=80871 RepID=UPI0004B15EF1|nr:type II CAAX endopeptidase family protein [Cryptosporangium arvum]
MTPYHRLARTPTNRWWKTLLGFVLAPIAYLVVVAAGALVLLIPGVGSDVGPLAEFALGIGAVAVMLPIVLLVARVTQGRRPGTLSSVLGRLRWRWMLLCGLLAIGTSVLSLALLAVVGPDGGEEYRFAGWATFAPALLVVLALVPVQAAAEEYLCRGWILQSVAAFVGLRWIAIGVQALVFTLLHGIGTGWGFVDLMVFGGVAGWLAIRTGGLEAGIAAHAVNNVLAFGIAVSAVGGLTIDETAADSGWQLAVVDSVVFVGYAVAVHWLAKRMRVESTRPESTPPEPARITPEPALVPDRAR